MPDWSSDWRYLLGGVATVVVGLVILVPSGLCTGTLLLEGLRGISWDRIEISTAIGTVIGGGLVLLIFGGPFIFLGAKLIWIGIQRFRE